MSKQIARGRPRGRPKKRETFDRLFAGTASQKDATNVAARCMQPLDLCMLWITVNVAKAQYINTSDSALVHAISKSAKRHQATLQGKKIYLAEPATLRRRYAEAKRLLSHNPSAREFCEKEVQRRLEEKLLAMLAQLRAAPGALSVKNKALAKVVRELKLLTSKLFAPEIR